MTPPTIRRLPRTSRRRGPQVVARSDTDLQLDADSVAVFSAPSSFTATVTPTSPGAGDLTGTVAFQADSVDISGCATVPIATGVATCSSPPTAGTGTRQLTATYSGDDNFVASGTSVLQSLDRADTAAVITSSDPHPNVGAVIVYTATFSPVSPATATPDGGLVIFEADTTPIDGCDSVPLSGGEATCTTTASPRGTVSITAMHSATSDFNAGSSPTFVQDVGNLESTTTVSSNDLTSTFNQSVTLTATVAPVILGDPTPAGGTVSFNDDDTPLTGCETQPIAGGVATCDTADLGVGDHTITASFSGDSGYTASSSAPISQAVTKAGTSLVVTSGTNPSKFSAPTAFTATVTSSGTTPTGTVAFRAAGTTITGCANSPITAGTATCTTSALTVGTRSITGIYSGDGSFATSTSIAESQVVSRAGTTSAVTSSDPTTTFGDPVTFTATIAPVSPATATPNLGTVRFNVDGVPIDTCGAEALTGGVATCVTTSYPVGTAGITAAFSGDATFTASTSPAIAQAVAKTATTVGLASNHNPSRSGQPVTFTATVISSAGTPNGFVTFSRVKKDSSLKPLGTASLASGVAAFTTAALLVQNGHVVASYATTTNYRASTHTFAQRVSRSSSKPYVAATRKNSHLGRAVSYRVVVISVRPGAGTPTGLVALYRERANRSRQWIGRGNLRSGETSITATDLPLGHYRIIAVFRGSTSHRPSERSMTQTVTS